jgi:DNA-binding transcriptional LysR family regulator
MEINLDALAAFVEFSECLNFTQAAARLHISQPALHVKIRKLSEQLGVALYVRVGRELRLSRHGVDLARFGRETKGHVSSFLATFAPGHTEEPIRLSAGAGCYRYLLGEGIRRFKVESSHPLCLLTANREQTLHLLETGEAHLGVTVLDVVPPQVEAKLMLHFPAQLIVPRGHRLAKHRTVTLLDLKNTALIVPPKESRHRIAISQLLALHKVPYVVAVEAAGWDLMMHFVALGLGLTIVNGCCQVPAGTKAIPISDFPGSAYYLVRRRSFPVTPSQTLLRKLLLTHVTH